MATAGRLNASQRLQIAIDGILGAAMAKQRQVLVASVQAYAQAAFDDAIRQTLSTATAGARTDLAAMILGRGPEEIDGATAQGLGAVVHALIVGLSLQALLDPRVLAVRRTSCGRCAGARD